MAKEIMETPQELNLPQKFWGGWLQGQAEAIEAICDAPEKIFLLDASTGAGKSAIAVASYEKITLVRQALAIMLDREDEHRFRCIYVTRTKQLQAQLCIGLETRVLTSDLRWIFARDVKVGNTLMAFDEYAPGAGNRRKWKNTIVESAEQVLLPSYRLTFDDGTVIVCSADHLWLTVSFQSTKGQSSARWIKTANLRDINSGKFASKISRLLDVWTSDDSKAAGYIAAGFDGEGHFHQRTPVRGKGSDVGLIFSQTSNEMLIQMEQYLIEKKFSYKRYVHTWANGKYKDCINLEINKRPHVLRLLGEMRPVRLLAKFDPNKMGAIFNYGQVTLIKKEFLGLQKVIALKTDAHTFVAEGLASHNCADFPKARTVKGRANYPCALHEKDFPAYSAEHCTNSKATPCPRQSDCSYLCAKRAAVSAPLAVLNDSYFLAEANGPGQFSGANMIIADECDNLDHSLMSFIQLEISEAQLKRFKLTLMPGGHKTIMDWKNWILDIEPQLLQQLRDIEQKLLQRDPSHWSKAEMDLQKYLKRLEAFHLKLYGFLADADQSWIMMETFDKTGWKVTFKPVQVAKYAEHYLWRHGEQFLGMSGTILDPKIMASDLGIWPGDYSYRRMDSTFPVENRPIYYWPAVSLNRASMETELPKLAAAVQSLLERYPADKVLVHTVSYRIRDCLLEHLPHERLVTHDSDNREDMLALFRASPRPLALLSPSFDRGVDLSDDACRCVIVCKMPFMDLSDKQTKARMQIPDGNRWYQLKAIQTLMQMTGRAVRSPTDHADTWILDGAFDRLLNMTRYAIPKWWLEAIHRCNPEISVGRLRAGN